MSVVDRLLDNAGRYAQGFDKGALPKPPRTGVAVLACMDARLNPYGLLGLEEGDAHVIRNAGGMATDDVIRSLMISQRLLGTEEVIVIQHTDCGMLSLQGDELSEQIRRETGVQPPFALEALTDVEEGVRQSVARIQASPFIPRTDGVRGFVYEVETGRLRSVTPG